MTRSGAGTLKPEPQQMDYDTSLPALNTSVIAKEMLEPMRPVVTALQGRLVEVYFGFKNIR
jgi:hypothetical protein